MDPTTAPFLSRDELLLGLRGGGCLEPGCWEAGWAAELLAHASTERLSPAGLAALATARRCLDQANQALRELERAQLALADALETPYR